jgi:hypothetical protein
VGGKSERERKKESERINSMDDEWRQILFLELLFSLSGPPIQLFARTFSFYQLYCYVPVLRVLAFTGLRTGS